MAHEQPNLEDIVKQYDLSIFRGEVNAQFSSLTAMVSQVVTNTSNLVTKEEYDTLKRELEDKIGDVDKKYDPLKKNTTKLLWLIIAATITIIGGIALAIISERIK